MLSLHPQSNRSGNSALPRYRCSPVTTMTNCENGFRHLVLVKANWQAWGSKRSRRKRAMSEPLSRPMKFATSAFLFLGVIGGAALSSPVFSEEAAFVKILRGQVRESGFQAAAALYQNREEYLVPIGKVIFESKGLS